MANVSTAICSSFSAAPGDEVVFTGVVGTCSITQPAGTTWPFTAGPPINFPLAGNTKIYIKSTGLVSGHSYPYIPSQCTSEVQKTVTITAK